jgi:hypothetical protein
MLRTSPSQSGTAATMTIQVAPVGEGSLACPNGYRDATLALREAKAASQMVGWWFNSLWSSSFRDPGNWDCISLDDITTCCEAHRWSR